LLPLAVIELKRLFAEQGIADYTDIALTAGAALGTAEDPGDIALLLDYQVRHVLVDEMQDTSSAQYGMLESLTGGWEQGDGRTLYCVGDPMQSIYRFRNAEVGRFLLAREHGIGHILLEPLLLRQNFRSGENLVEWFNEVFPSMLAPRDDPLRAAVSYSESVPVQHLEGQGSCVVHPVFGADADLEATAGCNIVAATLANHPDDDMAVLVRGRTHLPQLLAELRNAGIAYRAVEIDRLTDLPEIIDVLALTRAAVHLGDRVAWLGILRAPWMGLEWNDLHALTRNDTGSTIWELLQDRERLSSLSTYAQEVIGASRGILSNLTTMRRAQSLRDLVERTWIALGGPGALDDDYAVENVYRYFDVLGKMERAGTLMDVAELESILDLERVSTTGDARLQIMTIHRAKGLQFDHVLLYGLGRAPGSGDRRVLSWFDMPGQHGEVRKIISPVGARAEVDNDPVHRYIELTEAEKGRHEQTRLLYVACTRARKSLHLLGNTKIAPDGGSFRPARSDSLLHLLWRAVEPEFTKSFAKHTVVAPAQGESVWLNPVLRRFVSSWQLPEVELLPGYQDVDDIQDDTGEVEFYWVGTEARIAGTLVHRWLHLMANGRANQNEHEASDLRPVTQRWLREMGVANDMSVLIIERVEAAVSGMLNDEKGRWILEGDGHAELGLSGVYEGEISSVVLDRVRIDDDGTHWIIDYKTSSHEGGDLEGFLQVEAERYRPQLAHYASVYGAWAKQDAKCALYFPLLQSFVEL
jgi:ATP-dependent exoDNAse (exonuclease V) beta subunit